SRRGARGDGMSRNVTVGLGTALTLGLVGAALAISRASGEAPPVLWDAPGFALVDQTGEAFHSAELAGTVWVGSFIYTSCPDICPTITARLAALRDSLRAEDLLADEVRLVSFTVDPERDTPAVLARYAARFGGATPDAWAFLTGAPADVRRVITDGFYMPATRAAKAPPTVPSPEAGRAHAAHGATSPDTGDGGEPAAGATDAAVDSAGDYLVAHTDRIVLVDGVGSVRGVYSALEPSGLDSLRADLGTLLR
ncbi:MAG: SCO family protein, partial [Longimicrobiales bacterium]